MLDIPFVTGVRELEFKDSRLLAERSMDEFIEKYELFLPAAVAVHPAAVQSRDAGLYGIEKAFGTQEFEKMSLADLDLSPDQVGDGGSATRVLSMAARTRS